ncbi:MAG: 30S ribosomal protein S9 [Dehalogenimonas sp.]|jgi:small subunit ribosomal protein S9|uniref:Small ribosomal subunit protein uS9 n=1 Tax=Candidatus Dehalogenimonas loeffleri TaxID=3127115 RepID=A0ABZ2JBD5_9CHLR|nr:30S ribosomal protein S9 [Dehalogenimonas sp.]
MEKKNYFQGTGRRKTAVAQVRLTPGKGAIVVDGKPFEERFNRPEYLRSVMKPFEVTDTVGKFSVMVKCSGGGIAGQSDAIAMGLSRALVAADENHKGVLRENGLLTRDSRTKERKKPGLKRARKAPQYTKR